MRIPNPERVLRAYKLVTEAEREWRAAWPDGILAGVVRTEAISSGLSTARDMLKRLVDESGKRAAS